MPTFDSGFLYYLTQPNSGIFLLDAIYQDNDNGVHTFLISEDGPYGPGGTPISFRDEDIVSDLFGDNKDKWFITFPMNVDEISNSNSNSNSGSIRTSVGGNKKTKKQSKTKTKRKNRR